MEPAIGASIAQGFRIANRSWPGMLLFVACWMGIMLLAAVGLFATHPPREVFEPPTRTILPAVTAPQTPPTPAMAPAPKTASTAPDLFKQLEQAPKPLTPTDIPAPSSTSPSSSASTNTASSITAPQSSAQPVDPEAILRREQAERTRRQEAWLSQAWPVLLVVILALVVAGIWLTGGQIGYVAARLSNPQAPLAEFWLSASRAFGALFGSAALAMLAAGIALLVLVLLIAVGSAVGSGIPVWLRVVLAVALTSTLVMSIIWLSVRLAFWSIAIVADRLGPIAGFKATLRSTRGRWWHVFGLGLVLLLISLGIGMGFGLLEWIGELLGGAGGDVLKAIGSIANGIANVYLGFVMTTAFIQFYRDAATSSPV